MTPGFCECKRPQLQINNIPNPYGHGLDTFCEKCDRRVDPAVRDFITGVYGDGVRHGEAKARRAIRQALEGF